MWEWFLYLISHWCTDLQPMAEQALNCWVETFVQTYVNVCRKPEDLSGVGKTCRWTYTRRIFTVTYTVQRVSLIPISSYMLPVRPHFFWSLALFSQICCLLFCFPFSKAHRWGISALPYFFIGLDKSSPALKVCAHEPCQYLFHGDKAQHK